MWEFLQNLPLVCAFTFGRAALAEGNLAAALSITTGCALIGSLLIRYTEPAIRPGVVETWRETITNTVFFTTAVLLFIFYFSWNSGSLPLDLVLGVAAGLSASVLQAAAAREAVSPRHTLALAASFALALALIRLSTPGLPPFQGALLINLPVTTVIVSLDYRWV